MKKLLIILGVFVPVSVIWVWFVNYTGFNGPSMIIAGVILGYITMTFALIAGDKWG